MFLYLLYYMPRFTAPVNGFSLQFCNGSRSQEIRMMALPDRQNVSIYTSIRLDTISTLDGRWTDRRMELVST